MAKTSIRMVIGDKKDFPIRFSYFNGFTPSAAPGQTEKKYSTAVLINKKDKETIAAIEKHVANIVKTAGFKGKVKLPLRDGDDERPDDANYAGHYFLNASNKNRPTLVDRKGAVIIDPEELYSGCYGAVSVNFYDFDTAGNKGVGVALNHVIKLKDGEKLSGGPSADEDFAGLIASDDDSHNSLLD